MSEEDLFDFDSDFEYNEEDLDDMDQNFINSIQEKAKETETGETDSAFSFWMLLLFFLLVMVFLVMATYFLVVGRRRRNALKDAGYIT